MCPSGHRIAPGARSIQQALDSRARSSNPSHLDQNTPPSPDPVAGQTNPPNASVGPTSGSSYNPQGVRYPFPPSKPKLLHPRKVRGGVKLSGGEVAGPVLWAAQRWLRLLEQASEGAVLVEGLDYARLGQTKRIAVSPGVVEALIQGRADRPYTTTISFSTIDEASWHRVVGAMSEGAIYAAKLLAGELPSNIENVFGPLNLKLFPVEPGDATVSCTCDDHKAAAGGNATPSTTSTPNTTAAPAPAPTLAPGITPISADSLAIAPTEPATSSTTGTLWCKHVCCLAYLLAQRLANEPFLMFAIRGLDGAELLDRLRDRRLATGLAASGAMSVYQQRPSGVADMPVKPLDELTHEFWDAGPGLDQLDFPLTPPPLSHPLLRRLGQSPITGAQFPLVGLLASCYDVIGDDARKSDEVEMPPSETEGDGSDGDDGLDGELEDE